MPDSPDEAVNLPNEGETRARLAELRRSAANRAAALESGFDAIVDAASDVATDDEHDPEGHTIAWERQQVAGLLAETNEAVAAIEAAEHRLDQGCYGICTGCGEAISRERLEVLPATPTCVDCAARPEP